MVDFYKVPVYELNRIKNGADFVTPEGEVIANSRLTRPSAPARKYAYCSDTMYLPKIAGQIKGVDLLFHESTFAQTEQARAKETYHTTAAQAAQLALDAEVKQLVIGHFSARYEDESVLLNEAAAIFPQTILAKIYALTLTEELRMKSKRLLWGMVIGLIACLAACKKSSLNLRYPILRLPCRNCSIPLIKSVRTAYTG